MKKAGICILFVLFFVTGCQSSTENIQETNVLSMETENKNYENDSMETFGLLESIQCSDQEYDVYKFGKEIKNYKNIYFSNESLVCYSEVNNSKNTSENFFLYHRKEKKKNKVITVKKIDTCWGSMCEKDDCLYLAMGVVKNAKEKSYLLKIDEKTAHGELIEIEDCNTVFSSVVCSGGTLYIWYMKEQGDSKEYCLGYWEEGKMIPIHSWIYKGKNNGTGQQMSTLGTNGDELFCYVEDDLQNAHIEIYDGKGKMTRNIPIDFSDFQITSEENDVFWKIYCFQNVVLFETLNHRILVAEYDGNHITRVQEEGLAEGQNSKRDRLESGDYIGVTSTFDQMVLCGSFENSNELLTWDIDNQKVKNIIFQAENAEVLSYQMLSANEVIVTLVTNHAETREFYCNIDLK